MAPRTKSVNTHSTSFRHRHLPATTFPSPKGNQTHLDNSNRPTTTATPPRTRSNPYHPSPTPPTPPPTPSKATSDPRRRLAGRFPAFPRGPRERERKKRAPKNRQPPTARPDPARSDPADRRVSSSSPRAPPKHCIAPPPRSHEPGMARRRRPWCAACTGPGQRQPTGLGSTDGRDAPCRSRAFAWGGGGTSTKRLYREKDGARHIHVPSSRPAIQTRLSL